MTTPSRRAVLRTAIGGAAFVFVRPAFGAHRRQDTHATPASDTAAFLAAVERGDLAFVEHALADDATLAASVDGAGRTALVLALLGTSRPIVDLLVAHGAPIGWSEAVMLPDWKRAEELWREDGTRLDAALPAGGTALWCAARAGAPRFFTLQGWGADNDGNPLGERGSTPPHGALECPDPLAAWCGLVDLVGNGSRVDTLQHGHSTLLHTAARRGDERLVRVLVRRGASLDARDRDGATPADVARAAGHAALAAMLTTSKDADGTRKDTVLLDHFATKRAFDASGAPVVWPDLSDLPFTRRSEIVGPAHSRLERVRELVAAEPRLAFATSNQDEVTIEAAAHTGAVDIARFLLDRGLPQSLCTSLSIGDLDRARAIVDAHPDAVRERGAHDFPAMWYVAIGERGVEAAEFMLSRGAAVDQESLGTTALHWAASFGSDDLVRFLAERGADVRAVGYKWSRAGHTPHAIASERGHPSTAALLAELGGA